MKARGVALFLLTTGVAMTYAQTASVRGTSAAQHEALTRYWLRGESPDVPNKCGLPAVTYAIQHRDNPAIQSALNEVLSRPLRQTNILRGSFRIHYDTSGINQPAILNTLGQRIPNTAHRYADSVAAIANYVLQFDRDSLGFLPPPPDNSVGGGPEYDIYIQELSSSYYGLTTPEEVIPPAKPDGGKYTTYMIIDNDFIFVTPDSNKGLPGLRVTLAHELHHAIQIGNYGYWSSDVFFHEITSVWMEDAIFPEVNDYFQYVNAAQGHFRNPEVSFTSNTFIMYSRGIWCQFVAKRFGRATIRRFWERVQTNRPITAMDETFGNFYGTTLRNAFAEWSIWNYFTGQRSDSIAYYPEGRFYRLLIPASRGYNPPSGMIGGETSPMSSRYFEVTSPRQNLTLLITNVDADASQANNSQQYAFTIDLNDSKVDNDFVATSSGIFFKLNVADRSQWYGKDLFGASGVEGPFPNPFIADGKRIISFPINSPVTLRGLLSVFSSSMDLVYSAEKTSVRHRLLGTQVLEWDGRNENNDVAGSGIYVYVISLPDRTLKGKIAILRK